MQKGMPVNNPDRMLLPEEVKAMLMSCARTIEQMESVRPQLNKEAQKTIDEALAYTKSGKKKLEYHTMGGKEMTLGPPLEPGEEDQYRATPSDPVEREVIDIPNDQGKPKLERLIAEITDILMAEDIAGAVVLHTPGHAEFLLHISPSYSCARFEGEGLRIRARASDFPGPKAEKEEAKNRALAATANMFDTLATTTGKLAMDIMDMSEMVNKVTQAKHFAPIEEPAGKQAEQEPLNVDEYQFKAVSRITLKPTGDKKTSSLLRNDFYLEVFGAVDPRVYTEDGLPTKEGIKPLTLALAIGLAFNIQHAHQKGWWDSAEHLRYVIDQLEKRFVDVVYPTEGLF